MKPGSKKISSMKVDKIQDEGKSQVSTGDGPKTTITEAEIPDTTSVTLFSEKSDSREPVKL